MEEFSQEDQDNLTDSEINDEFISNDFTQQ